jgi:hypothetical protein
MEFLEQLEAARTKALRPQLRVDPKITFLYGKAKVGKTTILSHLEDCLIIDVDVDGADYLKDVNAVKVSNIQELIQVITMLSKADAPKYKFLAVDHLSQIERWAEALATAEFKNSMLGKNKQDIKSVIELPNGIGYHYIREKFFSILTSMYNLAENIIFVGHCKKRTIEETNLEITDIDLYGKTGRVLASQCSAVGYLYREVDEVTKEDKLMVDFETSEELDAGTRCEHLIGEKFMFDWERIYIDKNEHTK